MTCRPYTHTLTISWRGQSREFLAAEKEKNGGYPPTSMKGGGSMEPDSVLAAEAVALLLLTILYIATLFSRSPLIEKLLFGLVLPVSCQ